MDTLSEVTNALTKEGFTESFRAGENYITALFSKRNYMPEDLTIVGIYRFEGMTDPADQTELFAIEANDGTKGTLSMTFSAESGQNQELITRIRQEIRNR